jgi:toxin ParE1/3/4
MRAYRLSREAAIDLQEIEHYSALRWGDAKAAEYINDLFHAFQLLAENPDIGKPKPMLRKELLLFPVNRHAIIFKTDEKTEIIYILRVLHSAMNIKARLKKKK